MRLTEAELAEGRRLLEESRKQQAIDRMGIAATVWNRWVAGHADALLASPEEIARDAVREFAAAMLSDLVSIRSSANRNGEYSRVDHLDTRISHLKKLAAARGATLDEKP